jgi:hypothetical protein
MATAKFIQGNLQRPEQVREMERQIALCVEEGYVVQQLHADTRGDCAVLLVQPANGHAKQAAQLTTNNWRLLMNSKDAARKVLQLLENVSPDDRPMIIQAMAGKARDWDELEGLTRPIRTEMTKRSRVSGKP